MTIYIVDIEPVETRYTKQWREHLPAQLRANTNHNVVAVSGSEVVQTTTPGAFLNFAGTNSYKSEQLLQIAEMFERDEVQDGDYFLYTDAWNPTVIQLKYMAELLGRKIRIGGLWHAGSYDPQDFLGRLIGDAPWVRSAEHSMFSCYDDNFFATDFHVDMFARETFGWNEEDWTGTPYDASPTIKRVGWPMEYLADALVDYKDFSKSDTILFPHRLSSEKQLPIFEDLAESMPHYDWVVCQRTPLSKGEYHEMLARSKMVFSANLQETLGISWYEGALVGSLPLVPDRLSYSEMALDEFKYPSQWTIDWDMYQAHKPQLMQRIDHMMSNYDAHLSVLNRQVEKLQTDFFSGAALYRAIGAAGHPRP